MYTYKPISSIIMGTLILKEDCTENNLIKCIVYSRKNMETENREKIGRGASKKEVV